MPMTLKQWIELQPMLGEDEGVDFGPCVCGRQIAAKEESGWIVLAHRAPACPTFLKMKDKPIDFLLYVAESRGFSRSQLPILLISFKKVPGSGGLILHGFLAANEAAAEKMQQAHAAICPQYGPALDQGNTIDSSIEVDEIPEFDGDAIDRWLDDMFSLEDEEDGDEPEDGEPEPEAEEE
jgi:hypothetical protein